MSTPRIFEYTGIQASQDMHLHPHHRSQHHEQHPTVPHFNHHQHDEAQNAYHAQPHYGPHRREPHHNTHLDQERVYNHRVASEQPEYQQQHQAPSSTTPATTAANTQQRPQTIDAYAEEVAQRLESIFEHNLSAKYLHDTHPHQAHAHNHRVACEQHGYQDENNLDHEQPCYEQQLQAPTTATPATTAANTQLRPQTIDAYAEEVAQRLESHGRQPLRHIVRQYPCTADDTPNSHTAAIHAFIQQQRAHAKSLFQGLNAERHGSCDCCVPSKPKADAQPLIASGTPPRATTRSRNLCAARRSLFGLRATLHRAATDGVSSHSHGGYARRPPSVDTSRISAPPTPKLAPTPLPLPPRGQLNRPPPTQRPAPPAKRRGLLPRTVVSSHVSSERAHRSTLAQQPCQREATPECSQNSPASLHLSPATPESTYTELSKVVPSQYEQIPPRPRSPPKQSSNSLCSHFSNVKQGQVGKAAGMPPSATQIAPHEAANVARAVSPQPTRWPLLRAAALGKTAFSSHTVGPARAAPTRSKKSPAYQCAPVQQQPPNSRHKHGYAAAVSRQCSDYVEFLAADMPEAPPPPPPHVAAVGGALLSRIKLCKSERAALRSLIPLPTKKSNLIEKEKEELNPFWPTSRATAESCCRPPVHEVSELGGGRGDRDGEKVLTTWLWHDPWHLH